MTEKIFRMKKGGQGPRGILGRIPFRENTCQCPKARCRAVPGPGSAARECRGRGGGRLRPGRRGRRLAAGRRGSRRRDGRSPETGAVRSPSLAGSAHIGEALPRCGSVASARERGRRCGLRAAPGGEALRRTRGGSRQIRPEGTPRRSPHGLFPARGSHAADVKARCQPGRCSCPQRCLAG